MGEPERVKVYSSEGADYHRAFQVFLDHTDQKANARAWLQRLVDCLPSRRVLIDAGAGNGKVTAWFAGHFGRTIGIEPNPSLRDELARHCPSVEVLPDRILDAVPPARADLVLCSHVLYYIDGATWMEHLNRMASWLVPGGVLVVVLQNHETDCMRMVDAFLGRRFDLRKLAGQFRAERGEHYQVAVELVPAHVTTPDRDSAYTVAEFMLNLLPLSDPPPRRALEDYVEKEFRLPGGGYRFSCHQDFVHIGAPA